MRISMPLHVLQASNIGGNVIGKRASQLPMSPLVHDQIKQSERHPVVVIGDALNWCHTTRIPIGSPLQYSNAVLDISTSNLIIPSSHLRRNDPPPLHFYNSSLSSTYKPNGTEISSEPLGIETSGFLSQDKFHISDLIFDDLLFEEATNMNFEDCMYCNWSFDTVLPLRLYTDSNPRNFMSPMAKLTSAKLLDENIFSMRLSRTTDDGVGQLVLGGRINNSFFTGPEIILPATNLTTEWAEDGLWKTTADSLTFGNESYIHHIFKQPTIAVFHTTFSWVVLPVKLAKKINRSIHTKNWGPIGFVDCSKRPHFPDLTVVLVENKFVMTPYDYIIEQNESGRISCMSAFLPGI